MLCLPRFTFSDPVFNLLEAMRLLPKAVFEFSLTGAARAV